ncbi:MAG: hypothetical protein ACREGH_04140 [Minisyncoccia bacterium]
MPFWGLKGTDDSRQSFSLRPQVVSETILNASPRLSYPCHIDAALISQYVPDYRERTFYISGPHSIVEVFKKTFREMGVSRFKIKSDFFPGYV